MLSHEAASAASRPDVPSMLDLVRLSPRRLFPPGGVELYRQIALLTEMTAGDEVLGVACGKGVSLGYFVTEHGVTASGVDLDAAMVAEAERWSKEEGLVERLQFQTGRSDSLPYRDEIFDLVIGEIGLANHCDPAAAVAELVRVAKPGGFVVLLQLVWKAPVDEARRQVLSDHLGARPLMVVEWKRLLREAGVRDIQSENWSDQETSFRRTEVKPFPDFAELFSLGERLRILRRAWRRWGWRGVRASLARENEVHRLLTNERILGLDLIGGHKDGALVASGRQERAETPGASGTDAGPTPSPAVAALPHPADAASREAVDADEGDTAGLPLFSEGSSDEDPAL